MPQPWELNDSSCCWGLRPGWVVRDRAAEGDRVVFGFLPDRVVRRAHPAEFIIGSVFVARHRVVCPGGAVNISSGLVCVAA